jgi:hypothetical protein
VSEPVRLVEERRFDPVRAVLVKHESRWWSGFQAAWRLCHDDRGWVADVEFTAEYEWGPGKHVMAALAARVRPADGEHDCCRRPYAGGQEPLVLGPGGAVGTGAGRQTLPGS